MTKTHLPNRPSLSLSVVQERVMSPPPWAQMTLGQPVQDILTRGQGCWWEGRETAEEEGGAGRQTGGCFPGPRKATEVSTPWLVVNGCDNDSTRCIGLCKEPIQPKCSEQVLATVSTCVSIIVNSKRDTCFALLFRNLHLPGERFFFLLGKGVRSSVSLPHTLHM